MTFGEELEPAKVDETDFEILKHLANNARIKLKDLSRLAKISIPVVKYRIKQLEKKKVIVGYKYALDAHKLGYQTCKACISLKDITIKKKGQLVEYCKLKPETQNIVLTVGPWDMEIAFDVK
ncbi:MAG: Lrp/AsnC family transcriptional regulator, partial [Candidatus Micrarchaeia archaeon]